MTMPIGGEENISHDFSVDVIVSWPRNADYPLWREFIRVNRAKFRKVIIVFTETNHGENYREFIKEAMVPDDVIIVESPPVGPNEDWRNVAVNHALSISDAEWIWFTEQDFFPQDGFWEQVETSSRILSNGTIGVKEGDRLHPCCLFMRRIILEQTRKNFGIRPDRSDHFSLIQQDLERLAVNQFFNNRVLDPKLYFHMAGLSHNMRLVAEGGNPNHDKPNFDIYVKKCMQVSVPVPTILNKLFSNYLIQK